MKQRNKRDIKRGITNFFGSLGYLLCFLQWFWAIMLYFSVIQSVAILFVPSRADRHAAQTPHLTFTPPSSLETAILVVVVIIMVAITLYALVMVPKSIVKTSNKVVHKTAESMAAIVIRAQHKEDTKKIRLKLTVELILLIKFLLIVIPLAFITASGLLKEQPLAYSVTLTIGCSLAGLCIVSFAAQYMFAHWLSVKKSDLW